MSTLLHAILDRAPALATLAQECKGCPGTLCKGCHGTEHGGGCPYVSISAPAPEPTWHCLNSRKPVIVILLSGFLSTTDSKEWRGNQVPPRYRKICIRFPTMLLSIGLPTVSPSTT